MSDKDPVDADTIVVEECKPTKEEQRAADASRIEAIKATAKQFDPPPPAELVEYFTLRGLTAELAEVAFATYHRAGFLQIGDRQFGNEPKEK